MVNEPYPLGRTYLYSPYEGAPLPDNGINKSRTIKHSESVPCGFFIFISRIIFVSFHYILTCLSHWVYFGFPLWVPRVFAVSFLKYLNLLVNNNVPCGAVPFASVLQPASPLALTFVRSELLLDFQCIRFMFPRPLHYTLSSSCIPRCFYDAQLCALPHWPLSMVSEHKSSVPQCLLFLL